MAHNSSNTSPDNQSAQASGGASEQESASPVLGTLEGATVPDRTLRHLDPTLRGAAKGDTITITVGTADYQTERTGTVTAVKRSRDNRVPWIDWNYLLEIEVTEGGTTRLYRSGTGDAQLEPWTVFSYATMGDLGFIDENTEVSHGWIVQASVDD